MGRPAPSRRELVAQLSEVQHLEDEWIRRQVLDNGRIDILMTEVLGYDCAPLHLTILKHQEKFKDEEGCLVLAPRGCGKTLTGTIARCVYEILRNRSIRICLCSRSSDNFKAVSLAIRSHFDSNAKLARIFGNLVSRKWDAMEWSVAGRPPTIREATITVVGIEGSVTGKHFDMLCVDDLVDEEWSRTALTRQRTFTYFYKTLLPTLEADGWLYVSGTKYHPKDLYTHFMQNEMAGERTLKIPALTPVRNAAPNAPEPERWTSCYPEAWPVERYLRRRARMGTVLFALQYQQDDSLTKGEIFAYEDFKIISRVEVPSHLPRYIGADLAISQKTSADYFALVVIAHDKDTDEVWVIDAYRRRLSFAEQRKRIVEKYDQHQCVKGGIEAVAYQQALFQEVRRFRPDLNIVKIVPKEDKVTRALRLSPRFESGKVFVVNTLDDFVEEMVLFGANCEHDDLFDAFDTAIASIKKRQRIEREEPPLF